MSALLVAYFASVAGLALFGLHRFHLLTLYWIARRRTRTSPGAMGDDAPTVLVQLPIYNERNVARRLVHAAARLDYPRDRLTIQVLDDSTDLTSHDLARLIRRYRRLGIPVEHVRRRTRDGFKAGALAEGLLRSDAEFCAVFDADFLPPQDFLRRTLPIFRDEAIGMVQSRWGHLNREFSLLTRLQSIFLDGHFQIEHVARESSGRFFNFNGTAGIWRRRCIDEAGGWHGDTLTEDLDLSYRAQLAGWRFAYLGELASYAELPTDMNAFKAQQHRWAKGSVQTARKLLPSVLRSRVAWPVKLEATLHLTNNLSYLLMLLPCLLWVPTMHARFDSEQPWMIAMGIAMSLTTACVIGYHLVCQRACGFRTRQTLAEMPALLSLGIGLSVNNGRAVLEGLSGHRSPFVRTPKLGVIDGRSGATPWSYRLRRNWGTWVELALAGYFVVGLLLAVQNGRWIAVPFLLLFFAGFLYVGLSSLGWRVDRVLRVASGAGCIALLGFVAWITQGLILSLLRV